MKIARVDNGIKQEQLEAVDRNSCLVSPRSRGKLFNSGRSQRCGHSF